MTIISRRPQPGDRVRRLADIHGTALAWFTVVRVAFNPTSDYRHILALGYGHDVDGTLCYHLPSASLNDQHRDVHGFVIGYEEGGAYRWDGRTN